VESGHSIWEANETKSFEKNNNRELETSDNRGSVEMKKLKAGYRQGKPGLDRTPCWGKINQKKVEASKLSS